MRAPKDIIAKRNQPGDSTASFHALQEWDGYVVEIYEDEFVARLVDLTAGHVYESEEATIPLKAISEHDAANMELGSFFRWEIGYETSLKGIRKRVSRIIFFHIPITKSDIERGRKWAEEILEAFESSDEKSNVE